MATDDKSAIESPWTNVTTTKPAEFAERANVLFVEDLPKTRSGESMRRLLADISNDEGLGNTSTLADPSVPERIRDQVQAD